MTSMWVEPYSTKKGDRYRIVERLEDRSKRTRESGFTSRKKADKALDELLAAAEAVPDRPGGLPPRYVDWVETWWADRASLDLKPSTKARYKFRFTKYLIPTFGHLHLDEITPLRVEDWLRLLQRNGVAATSRRDLVSLLGQTLEAAVRVNKLASNPCRSIDRRRLLKVRRDPHRIRVLEQDEVAKLREAIDPRYRALVTVGVYCGLRIGEMAALHPNDIDLVERLIHVRRTVAEGEKGGQYLSDTTKTEAGARSVTMPVFVANELAAHMADHPHPEFVFASPRGHMLRLSDWRSHKWRPAVRAAGIAKATPHDLRHTAVSLWAKAGVSPIDIAKRAGHKSASAVMDLYGHFFKDSDRELADRLDEQYGAA